MPSVKIKLDLPDELAEKIERDVLDDLNNSSSRHKIIQGILEEHYSLVPIINKNVDVNILEAGFDSIMERQFLKLQLKDVQLQYQRLFEEHEKLKGLYEISVSITKIKTPWWVRLKRSLFGH